MKTIKSMIIMFIIAFSLMFTIITTDLTADLTANEIKNEDKPLKGNWDFKIEKIWEIETAGTEVFAGISTMVADPFTPDKTDQENLYVADYKHYKIFIFDKNGKFISSFGKRGEGPGEFKRFGPLFRVSDKSSKSGKLVMVDGSKIHYFSLEGKYLESAIIGSMLKPRHFIDENTFISYPRMNWQNPKDASKVAIYDIKNKKETLLFTFNTFKKGTVHKVSGKNRSSFSFSTSDLTPLMVLTYHKDRIYCGMSNYYSIDVIDFNGKKQFTFSLEREAQKAPESHKKKLLEHIDFPDDIKKDIVKGLPDYFNYYYWMKVDDNGFIYVLVNEPLEENRTTFDIFSPQGKYLYRGGFRVAEGESIERIHFNNNRLYMAVENEDGDIRIIKYNIQLPSL